MHWRSVFTFRTHIITKCTPLREKGLKLFCIEEEKENTVYKEKEEEKMWKKIISKFSF